MRNHSQSADGLKVQNCFRPKLNLLALLCGSSGCSGAGSASRADRRSSAAADDTAKNRARSRTYADFGGRVLTFAFTGTRPLIRLDVVGFAVDRQRSQL